MGLPIVLISIQEVSKKQPVLASKHRNDKLLKEILQSLKSLKDEVAEVKTQLKDIHSIVKQVVAEEHSAKEQVWLNKTEVLENRIADLKKKSRLF